ncbi:MAG: hypothetical protein IT581_13970 [Verrucomicrobiales bacterium]|nr:hypothetical protein [Verrucomicrobiales bacterium]
MPPGSRGAGQLAGGGLCLRREQLDEAIVEMDLLPVEARDLGVPQARKGGDGHGRKGGGRAVRQQCGHLLRGPDFDGSGVGLPHW